jgi:hypothetical protein
MSGGTTARQHTPDSTRQEFEHTTTSEAGFKAVIPLHEQTKTVLPLMLITSIRARAPCRARVSVNVDGFTNPRPSSRINRSHGPHRLGTSSADLSEGEAGAFCNTGKLKQ